MGRKLLAVGLGACLAVSALFVLGLSGETPRATSAAEQVARARSGGPATNGRAAPRELLVRFARATDGNDRARLRERADTDLERALPLSGLQLLGVERGQSVRAAVAELERSQGVLYAEPNFLRSATATPDDAYFGHLWGLHNTGQSLGGSAGTPDADIDAPEAWDRETGSTDVPVAVVDTGVDGDHADLGSQLWTNPGERGDGRETNGVDDDGNGYRDDWRGWDWVDSDNSPGDANGHGTHVAGTIGARGNDGSGVTGVAWHAGLMPLRVLDAEGSGTVADAVLAYRYAAARGARVLNASLGGDSYSRAEADAIASAPQMLFVVAAGNGGADGLGDSNDVAAQYPCNHALANVVCVAASDRRDGLASFSNYGASSVDLAAPGVRVLSTRPANGFAFLDGTSMATPHVAGAAALLLARARALGTSATVAAVRSALLGGVDAKPAFAGRTATGGRLNADGSLRVLAGEQAPAPLPPPGSPAAASSPAAPGPTRSGTADTAAPAVSLTVRRRQRLRPVLRRGLGMRAACSESCELSVRVVVGATSARRLRLARARRAVTIASTSRSVTPTGATLRLRLSRSARRSLRRSRTLRVAVRFVARDAAGNTRRLRRAITLVR